MVHKHTLIDTLDMNRFSKSLSSWDLEQQKCRHNFHDASEIVPPIFEVTSMLFNWISSTKVKLNSTSDLTNLKNHLYYTHVPGANNHHHQLAHPQRAHSRCHGLRCQMLHQALNPLGFCSCRSIKEEQKRLGATGTFSTLNTQKTYVEGVLYTVDGSPSSFWGSRWYFIA